jgi:hypothetical protein
VIPVFECPGFYIIIIGVDGLIGVVVSRLMSRRAYRR